MHPRLGGASARGPALDRHGREVARVDEVADRGDDRLPVADAPVVGEIGGGRDPVCRRGSTDELADRVLAGHGSACVVRDHLGRQAVAAFESPAPGDGDLAVQPQVLEGGLHLVPVPPGSAPGPVGVSLDVGRTQRSASGQLVAHPRHRLGVAPRPAVGGVVLPAQLPHPEIEQSPVRRGDERGHVGPVLDEGRPPREQEPVQVGGLIAPQAREQRHVVRSGEDVHGIDLESAEAADGRTERAHPRAAVDGALAEALGGQRDPTRFRGAQRLLHPVSLTAPSDAAPASRGPRLA